MADPNEIGPRVSLITRTRRRPAFLARAAKAIGTYTYPDIEWIVVNDAGPRLNVPHLGDLSCKTGSDFAVIDLPRHGGRSMAGNAGLQRATGRYVLFHDDDDFLHPEAISIMVESLQADPSTFVGAVGSCAMREETWSRGRLMKSVHGEVIRPRHVPLLIDIANRNTLRTISTLVSRKVALEAGGFDERLGVLEDWDFWLRVLMAGDLLPVPSAMAFQSLRPEGEGVNSNSERDEHLAHEARLRNHYLREDLKSGRFGLGILTNVADRDTQDRLRTALRRAQRVFNPFGGDGRSGVKSTASRRVKSKSAGKAKVRAVKVPEPKPAKAAPPPARSPKVATPKPSPASEVDPAKT